MLNIASRDAKDEGEEDEDDDDDEFGAPCPDVVGDGDGTFSTTPLLLSATANRTAPRDTSPVCLADCALECRAEPMSP